MLFLKRVIKHIFLIFFLLVSYKSVSLHCVFHSIRFKVNKGWSTAVLLFLCLLVKNRLSNKKSYSNFIH